MNDASVKWVVAFLAAGVVVVAAWGILHKENRPDPYAPRPPIQADRLRLAWEKGVLLTPRVLETPGAADAGAALCWRIGPFERIDQMATAAARLEHMGAKFARREDRADVVAGYRIVLPPHAVRDAALREEKRLERLGLRDLAVIPADGGRYQVSLGRYAQKRNAEKRLAVLKGRGVEATIEPLTRPEPRYFLTLGAGTLTMDASATLKKVDWGTRGAQIEERDCATLEIR